MNKTNLGRVAVVPKGEWVAGGMYGRLDAVTHGGQGYLCVEDGTDEEPGTGAAWQLIAAKGRDFGYADFTEEQIAGLMKPATDAAAEIGKTNEEYKAMLTEQAKAFGDAQQARAKSYTDAERARDGAYAKAETDRNAAYNEAEGKRQAAERVRGENEEERKSAETGRGTAEKERAEAEGKREQAEQTRDTAETGRDTAEKARVRAEEERDKGWTDLKAEAEKSVGDAVKRAYGAADRAMQAAYRYPVWDAEAGEFTPESIRAWLANGCDGKVYGVVQTLDGTQALVKSGANAGMADPVPSTLAQPGTDPYRGVGPFRWWHANAHRDDDGTVHVTGINGFGHFSYTDGRDVFTLAPTRYVGHGTVEGTKYEFACSDTPHEGLMPEEKSQRADGTVEPFMLRATFAASQDADGMPRTVPYAKLWNFTCSHNSMQAACRKRGKWYSGMTAADWDYLYEMFLLKYANKSSQTVFAGCTAHYEQTPVTVAGSGAPTVTIAKTVADKWPIGSAVMVGTTTVANRDRGQADAHDIASQANIVAKTAAGDNVTLTLDCGPITTEPGQIVSTAPWNPGACVGLAGDGSPYDPKSGREPFMLQGIEVMLGAYEILGDQLAKCVAGGTWGMYQVLDTTKASTAVTADYVRVYELPVRDSDSSAYIAAAVKAQGSLAPYGEAGSSSLGTGDAIWVNKKGTEGEREVLVGGNLGGWGAAGLRSASLNAWAGWTWWGGASRVSVDGPNGVNPAEPPQAA